MYVDDCKYKRSGKSYRRVLLRDNVKINGKHKLDTIANISNCSDEEIEAIKIALKYKKNIVHLENLANGESETGKVVGDIAALYQVANRLGITKALGNSENAKLILWLVISRLIDQGSRLSSVRLAENRTVSEIIGMKSFCEDDLYDAMDWLYENQAKIEKRLFKEMNKSNKVSNIFLYDVSSSYLKGDNNELAEYGYNRDKKKGKKQVVFGLLTDDKGEPISIEVLKGNTKDNDTLMNQIVKLKDRFNCDYITIVGDKGMIKTKEIQKFKDLEEEDKVGWIKYITSITKPEIETLCSKGLIQLAFFDKDLYEIDDLENKIRYILRRNPYRAKEISENRQSKIRSIESKIKKSNEYLKAHPKAKVATQEKLLLAYISKLKLEKVVSLLKNYTERELSIQIDKDALEKVSRLDGCYVIKTDLPTSAASKEEVHDRYKDLAQVEKAFRVSKTEHLEVRPIYVRKKEKTCAHFFVIMLAYKIAKFLRYAWYDLNITVSEGINKLSGITSTVITIGEKKIVKVPKANSDLKILLTRLKVSIPEILPYQKNEILTRKNLINRRKPK